MTREYEWDDVTLMLGSVIIEGIRGIKYAGKREKEALYAKGSEPHSIQRGNISYEGEITLLQSAYESLRTLGNGTILRLSLNAICAYGTPPDVIITDELIGIEFTEEPKEFKQGDKFMEITLPFIFLRLNQIL